MSERKENMMNTQCNRRFKEIYNAEMCRANESSLRQIMDVTAEMMDIQELMYSYIERIQDTASAMLKESEQQKNTADDEAEDEYTLMIHILPNGITMELSELNPDSDSPEDEVFAEIPGTDLLMRFQMSDIAMIAGRQYLIGDADAFRINSEGECLPLSAEECRAVRVYAASHTAKIQLKGRKEWGIEMNR